MLQAYGEGFEILKSSDFDALDLRAISHLWNQGSVVRSWLLELAGRSRGGHDFICFCNYSVAKLLQERCARETRHASQTKGIEYWAPARYTRNAQCP